MDKSNNQFITFLRVSYKNTFFLKENGIMKNWLYFLYLKEMESKGTLEFPF